MAQSGIVTFLFTDLVQSTAQLESAGDEAGNSLFSSHHKLLTQAVSANGGEELEWLGDGILAAFSSASDAVRCAIRVQQTARRPSPGARFDIRIGIHTGEAIRRETGYFGTPIVTARRLCDRADAGQILCSKVIQDFLAARRGFEFRDVGPLQLKGLEAPVPTTEVIYERNDAAALLNRTPFVGREAQVQRLTAKLEETCNGRGAVTMLLGEPGIGKTRMLEEFIELAREHGAMVVRGACYDGEWQRPYGPFAEVLLDYARKADSEELKFFAKSAPTLARIAPALRDRLGHIVEPTAVDKDEERFRLFDAVSQLLIEISHRRPLVVVLDDLHWADRGTVAMLSHVAHFVSGNAILMIGAYRDAEVDRKHPLMGAVSAIRRLKNSEALALKGLASEAVTDLLGIIGDEEPPKELVRVLTAETGGNPFFIREVLLHLREEGKILAGGQGWKIPINRLELGVTEGVREVVRQRLLRLSDEANRLLTVGAAFNGSFSFQVASAVAELDEQAALSALDEALEAQLLRPGAHADTFDFTHALIRHTLYEELNPARRVRQHRRIAEQMERAWGELAVDHAAEVAYHFWRSAATTGAERGVAYAIAAADNAETAFAHDEVAAFLRIALELLPRNDPRRPRLLARLGLALIWTLNGEEALKIIREAGELIAGAEGTEAGAEYYEQNARAMFNAGLSRGAWDLASEGMRHIGDRRDITWASLFEIDINRAEAEDDTNPGIRTDSRENRELRDVLRQLPRAQLKARNIDPIFLSREEILNDPDPSPVALFMHAADFRASLPIWQRDAADNERRGAFAKAMRGWGSVARCHISLGDFTAAQAALDRTMALSARIAGPWFGVLGLIAARAEFCHATNEHWKELLAEAASQALIQGPIAESKWGAAMINAYLAYAFANLDQTQQAMQRVALLPTALERGTPWATTYCATACIGTAALWRLNRSEHAEVFEKNIRAKVIAPDFRYPLSDGRLSLARLCALQGRYDEASEWLAKARATLDEQGARTLRAICDYDEGLMFQRRGASGDEQRAHPYIEAARRQFGALGMTGWLRRTDQLEASGRSGAIGVDNSMS